MSSFKDATGHSWEFQLNLGCLMEVEKFDFAEIIPGREEPYYLCFTPPQEDMFQTVLTNSKICAYIVWIACKTESKDFVAFATNLNPQALDDLKEALYKELEDFFPELATSLRVLRSRTKRAAELADQKLASKIEEVMNDEAIDQMLETDLDLERILSQTKGSPGKTSGVSPQS